MKLSELTVDCYILYENLDSGASVRLERRFGNNGNTWTIRNRSNVLNHKTGEFEYEPIPSERCKKFTARTRFDSAEAALEYWQTTRYPAGLEEHSQIWVEIRQR